MLYFMEEMYNIHKKQVLNMENGDLDESMSMTH